MPYSKAQALVDFQCILSKTQNDKVRGGGRAGRSEITVAAAKSHGRGTGGAETMTEGGLEL